MVYNKKKKPKHTTKAKYIFKERLEDCGWVKEYYIFSSHSKKRSFVASSMNGSIIYIVDRY